MARHDYEHGRGRQAQSGGGRGGDGRGGRSRSGRLRRRFPSDFSYISGWVKWAMFFCNFLFWMLGLLLVGVGVYAVLDKWSSGEGFKLENVFDVIFNLAFLMVIVGGVVFVVSFCGCIGALRENVCLLQFFSLCLLLFFLAEMGLGAVSLLIPDKMSYFLEKNLSEELIQSYRDDLDFQNLIDLVQQEFECCGINANGYKNWADNEYFNCQSPSVEKCGVPFSCCLKSNNVGDPGLVNIMCGFDVQEKSLSEVRERIYTEGCLKSIRMYVESNLYWVGGIALGVAFVQLLVIWLARTLERQIENQRALWQIN